MDRKTHGLQRQVEREAPSLVPDGRDSDDDTLGWANNIGQSLTDLGRYPEARSHLRNSLKIARNTHGDVHDCTILLRETYAQLLYQDPNATETDLLEAEAMLAVLLEKSRQVSGTYHPKTVGKQGDLDRAKLLLKLFRARAARAASRAVQDAETSET